MPATIQERFVQVVLEIGNKPDTSPEDFARACDLGGLVGYTRLDTSLAICRARFSGKF